MRHRIYLLAESTRNLSQLEKKLSESSSRSEDEN